ncbi:hypothetical protein [Streptomyces sp. NBC_01373]|uniref:hypothetical protein n=1 Tax=Streptomyces sp. NBC_01373 TaxID=2903843 RepID=UPI00224FE73E|nr:hypothetical protein [Streptomyces sp. NBC_01373]MCX4697015.1 hypothetical protein [Streptomyces sp. NBC_01373]MCX4707060.1 hypothetical protein [Streptomyces sp. NBC_01373]
MSPTVLSDADLAVTQLGARRRASVTVGEAADAYAATLIGDYLAARADDDREQMQLIRDHAFAADPELLAELDGLHYPAAV